MEMLGGMCSQIWLLEFPALPGTSAQIHGERHSPTVQSAHWNSMVESRKVPGQTLDLKIPASRMFYDQTTHKCMFADTKAI